MCPPVGGRAGHRVGAGDPVGVDAQGEDAGQGDDHQQEGQRPLAPERFGLDVLLAVDARGT